MWSVNEVPVPVDSPSTCCYYTFHYTLSFPRFSLYPLLHRVSATVDKNRLCANIPHDSTHPVVAGVWTTPHTRVTTGGAASEGEGLRARQTQTDKRPYAPACPTAKDSIWRVFGGFVVTFKPLESEVWV